MKSAVSGNEVGLSLHEWWALSAQEQAQLRGHAYERLQRVDADYGNGMSTAFELAEEVIGELCGGILARL